MIYLDYSATTPVNKQVLKYYMHCNYKYFANVNSAYKIAVDGKRLIDEASEKILKLLNLNDEYEVIYTSGASESNNLVVKGIKNIKKIISSPFEHSSIVSPLSYMQKKGCAIKILDIEKDGKVDLKELENSLDDSLTLVTINSVNSEIGIKQPINELQDICSKRTNTLLHVDATQSVGKEKLDFKGIDFISFSGHKFYGLKGIGCLVKKKTLKLENLIHGGKSTTPYRSGTPALPLILSLEKALELSLDDFDTKYKKVLFLNKLLREEVSKIEKVVINSSDRCLPHIFNISILGYDSKNIVNYFDDKNIYISNHSACSSDESKSLSILRLTNDEKRSLSSIRISLSYLTKEKEIKMFIRYLKELLDK